MTNLKNIIYTFLYNYISNLCNFRDGIILSDDQFLSK